MKCTSVKRKIVMIAYSSCEYSNAEKVLCMVFKDVLSWFFKLCHFWTNISFWMNNSCLQRCVHMPLVFLTEILMVTVSGGRDDTELIIELSHVYSPVL